MPLSILKLEQLLETNGYIPKKHFTIDGTCAYIEVLSIQNAETFMLYIPSKYKFKMKSGSNIHKLKFIDMNTGNSTSDDYAGLPDESKLETDYAAVELDTSQSKKDGITMEKRLEENYNRPITLGDISTDDRTDVNNLYRQLHRLRYCVQGIRYKISIFYKEYLCTVRRDDTIDCLLIRDYHGAKNRRLAVTVDLELFYEKLQTISHDMNKVRNGMFKVLNRNQTLNTKNLRRMLEDKKDITVYSDKCKEKAEKFNADIIRFEELLERLGKNEKFIITSIYEIDEKYNDTAMTGLYKDIEKSHSKAKLESQLDLINKSKKNVIEVLMDLKEKRENTVLAVDRLLFDASVMFDAIVDSFTQLSLMCD
jgi:hypothetical protein